MPVFIKSFAYFVPSDEQPRPDVQFVPMLTRRRLSPLCRMVVAVNRKVSENETSCKTTFASQFGEISQQLKISESILETGNVSPAHFSLSVFNASIANATILEKNDAGYSAVFSGKDAFRNGLADCVAALATGNETERIFIFADEQIPETYAPVAGVRYPNSVCAVALRLTTEETPKILNYTSNENFETAADNALDFIKWLCG